MRDVIRAGQDWAFKIGLSADDEVSDMARYTTMRLQIDGEVARVRRGHTTWVDPR